MSHLLIATEAAADGGGSSLPFVLLVVALAVFAIAYVVVGPGRGKRGAARRGDIPLAMRPYHSDDELEKTALERAMAWGVALSVFMAIFLPLYWLIEPPRIDDKIDGVYSSEVELGRNLYANACATCHGADGSGGSAANPDSEIKAAWPAPALNNIVARYEDDKNVAQSCAGKPIDCIRLFMNTTIKQGRPGTPMPTWGAFYGGSMNDQEVWAIVEYVLSTQTGEIAEAQAFVGASTEDVYQANCARCHGVEGEGVVGPSLQNVFARYGGGEGAEATIRNTILYGRYIPTGAPMPAWGDRLTDGAIDKVIDFLKSIQQ